MVNLINDDVYFKTDDLEKGKGGYTKLLLLVHFIFLFVVERLHSVQSQQKQQLHASFSNTASTVTYYQDLKFSLHIDF